MLRFWIYRHRRLLVLLSMTLLGTMAVWSIEQFNHDLSFFILGNRRPTADTKKLEQFLKAGQWDAADRETTKLILTATHTSDDLLGGIEPRIVKRLPCADLQVLDQLWVKYSRGRFGFSVQKKIFEAIAKPQPTPELQAVAADRNKKLTPEKSPTPKSEDVLSPEEALELQRMGQFSSRVGLGLRQQAKPGRQAPAGRLPSWGVFFQQPASNFKPFSTPEFVQRQKWCRLS